SRAHRQPPSFPTRRSSDLPSASEMLKRLEHLGYVEPSPDGVQLTGTGVQIATQVVRRLRLAERLLTDILKMDLERVYDEACKMRSEEHTSELQSPCKLVCR